jgi:hypothetical protein
MDSLADNFLSADGQVTLSTVVATEQMLTYVPGSRLVLGARQVFIQALANQLGLRNTSGFGGSGQLSAELFVEP